MSRLRALLLVPVLGGVLLSTSLVGHAGVGELSALALPADAVHLAAASAWLGGVVLGLVVLRRHATAPVADLAAVLPRWSRWAAGSVAVLVVTGTFASWREVRELDALISTTYGRLLLVKTVLVAGMLALGALGRSWVRRHYATPVVHAATAELLDAPVAVPDPTRLRRSVLLEAGTAVVVLAVTALLVETTPARTAYAPLFSQTKTPHRVDRRGRQPGGQGRRVRRVRGQRRAAAGGRAHGVQGAADLRQRRGRPLDRGARAGTGGAGAPRTSARARSRRRSRWRTPSRWRRPSPPTTAWRAVSAPPASQPASPASRWD